VKKEQIVKNYEGGEVGEIAVKSPRCARRQSRSRRTWSKVVATATHVFLEHNGDNIGITLQGTVFF
jgi:hypothetical protein